jgi:hypothetical protein
LVLGEAYDPEKQQAQGGHGGSGAAIDARPAFPPCSRDRSFPECARYLAKIAAPIRRQNSARHIPLEAAGQSQARLTNPETLLDQAPRQDANRDRLKSPALLHGKVNVPQPIDVTNQHVARTVGKRDREEERSTFDVRTPVTGSRTE